MKGRRYWVWVFALAVVVILLVGFWRAQQTMGRFAQIETAFQSLTQRNFRLARGLRLRTNRLNAAAMRYAVTQDADYQERFDAAREDLRWFLSRQLPEFESEADSDLVMAMEAQLNAYVAEAEALMAKTGEIPEREVVRGLLSSVEKAREALDHLGELASSLSEGRVDGLKEELVAYQQTVRGLQWAMFVSLGFLLLGAVLLAWLARRAFVTPLRSDLADARTLVSRQEALANLGTMAAAIVHEIRNPIATMRARLFALEELTAGNAAANRQLALIEGQADRLERMSEGFLAFARPLDAQFREVALASFLREVMVAESLSVTAQGGHLEEGEMVDEALRFDPSHLHQALANLIRNAVEAAPGGTVKVSSRMLGAEKVRICVGDEGPGISEDMRAVLFVPFKTDKENGSGLGLPIVKSLVELQGGELSYECAESGGTVFHVDLPVVSQRTRRAEVCS